MKQKVAQTVASIFAVGLAVLLVGTLVLSRNHLPTTSPPVAADLASPSPVDSPLPTDSPTPPVVCTVVNSCATPSPVSAPAPQPQPTDPATQPTAAPTAAPADPPTSAPTDQPSPTPSPTDVPSPTPTDPPSPTPPPAPSPTPPPVQAPPCSWTVTVSTLGYNAVWVVLGTWSASTTSATSPVYFTGVSGWISDTYQFSSACIGHATLTSHYYSSGAVIYSATIGGTASNSQQANVPNNTPVDFSVVIS